MIKTPEENASVKGVNKNLLLGMNEELPSLGVVLIRRSMSQH